MLYPAMSPNKARIEGDCTLPVRPCRTIQVRPVRRGQGRPGACCRWRIPVRRCSRHSCHSSPGRWTFAAASTVSTTFSCRQSAAANPNTSSTGIPVALRDRLQDRGFQVIVDRKGLDAACTVGPQSPNYRGHANEAAVRPPARTTSPDAYPCKDVDLLCPHGASATSRRPPTRVADIWGFVDLNTEREYALARAEQTDSLVIDVTDPATPFEVGTVAGATFSQLAGRQGVATLRLRDAHRWRDPRLREYGSTAASLVVRRSHRNCRTGCGSVAAGTLSRRTTSMSATSTTRPASRSIRGRLAAPAAGARKRRQPRRRSAPSTYDDPVTISSPDRHCLSAATATTRRRCWSTDDRASSCKAGTRQPVKSCSTSTRTPSRSGTSATRPRRSCLSSTTYDNASYVHSGWWTEDGRYLFVHDELDEYARPISTPRFAIFDLEDLARPRFMCEDLDGPQSRAVDHNGYVRGNRYFMSNYTRGLAVLDITDPLRSVGDWATSTLILSPTAPTLEARGESIRSCRAAMCLVSDILGWAVHPGRPHALVGPWREARVLVDDLRRRGRRRSWPSPW